MNDDIQNTLFMEMVLAAQSNTDSTTDTGSTNPVAALHATTLAIAEKNNELIQAAAKQEATQTPPAKKSLGSVLPNYPNGNSSSLDPSITNADGTQMTNAELLSKLYEFIAQAKYHQNNTAGPGNFLNFLANLGHAGLLTPNSSLTSVLNSAGLDGSSGLLAGWVQQGEIEAMFAGYTTQSGVVLTGGAAATAFLADMSNLFAGAGSSPTAAAIQSAITAQQGTLQQTWEQYGFNADGTGTGTINFTIPGTTDTLTYNWANQGDQSFILEYIANLGQGGTPNSALSNLNLNAVSRTFRMAAIDQVLATYKDPAIIISLLMGIMTDNAAQDQMSGISDQTNTLNQITNNYVSPITSIMSRVGTLSDADVKTLLSDIDNATFLVTTSGQMSGLSSSWVTNFYNSITSIVPVSGLGSPTLGQLMANARANQPGAIDALKVALNTLNPNPSGGTGGNSTVNPGYQALQDAVQSGGSLVTGVAQPLVTQLGTISQNDSAILKAADSIRSSYAQMQQQIITNQISH